MITRSRKVSVDDYPEHLNPFYDEDENEDLRNNKFNTTGRRRARPSLKDAWFGGWADVGADGGGGGGAAAPGDGGGGTRWAAASHGGGRFGSGLGRTHSDSYRLRYASRSGYHLVIASDQVDGGGGRRRASVTTATPQQHEASLGRTHSFSYGRWDRGPAAALDVAVPAARGPTPARPPPPRLGPSPPPQRPASQPPPPLAEPGKPTRRRFSFSRTLDAGSRLLLSPALLRRLRPGAAPQPPPKDSPTRPPPPDARASMRRSQSQAIPTMTDESGLSSRAGSNWTLAEGGLPHRMSGARPKKRKAPPPPVPVSVAATPTPPETAAANVTDREVPSEGTPAPRGGETTTPDVPAETKPGDQTVISAEERPKSRVSDAGSAEEVVLRVRGAAGDGGGGEQRIPDRVAPLAQGEDTAVYDGDSTGDVSTQSGEAKLEAGEQRELPSLEVAVVTVGEGESNVEDSSTLVLKPSEDHVSSDSGVPSEQEACSEEGPQPTPPSETSKDTSEGVQTTMTNGVTVNNTIELKNTAKEGSVDETLGVGTTEDELPVKTPVVLTVDIQVNKETSDPVVKESTDLEESKIIAKTEDAESQSPIESPTKQEATFSVVSQMDTEVALGQPTVEDTEGSAAASEKFEATKEEPSKSALETFREEYLAEHYKQNLPVLQITESDLAEDKDESITQDNKEDKSHTKLPDALPVLHISEEDLRDPPTPKADDSFGTSGDGTKSDNMEDQDAAAVKMTSRLSLDGGERPRKEPPKPPTRHSSGQELNSKIYFRVLPPIDHSGGTPQLKTFASPSSPPGRREKPEPTVRNGLAAAHLNDTRTSVDGDSSPPRTKSPLPTPRRRHQPTPASVSDT